MPPLTLKLVTLEATSYLEKWSHEKTAFETTLFPCISYKYWNRIVDDQDVSTLLVSWGLLWVVHPQILFPVVFYSLFFLSVVKYFILSYWFGKLKPEDINR